MPRVHGGALAKVQQYSMPNLHSTLEKAKGKAPGSGPPKPGGPPLQGPPGSPGFSFSHSGPFSTMPHERPTGKMHTFWHSPKVPGSANLDEHGPMALSPLDMKLLIGPLSQRPADVLTQNGMVSDWQQGVLCGSNTPPPPVFMAQRELLRGKSNYIFTFCEREAFNTALHGALNRILRHLPLQPAVIDLVLIQAGARLRIATAHRLTQPVHMQRGVRQGSPQNPLLNALLLHSLLRSQGNCLRPQGEAERGRIQVYIDNLLVVADTLQDFVEAVELVPAYIGTMGIELNPCKFTIATTRGLPGLHPRLCRQLAMPPHWVLAVNSVPYLGLQLQLDGVLSVRQKH